MSRWRRTVFSGAALAAVLGGLAAVPAGQVAQAAQAAPAAQAPSGPDRAVPSAGSSRRGQTGGAFYAVSALSPDDAWAAGLYCRDGCHDLGTLVSHWNGTAWSRVKSPSPAAGENVLAGVSAVSPADAWAAGYFCTIGCHDQGTLILHWNGTAWSRVSSPSPGGSRDSLSGVSAVSPADAWAAGFYCPKGCRTQDTLILHWNGKAWSSQAAPNPGRLATLSSVSAVSPADAWAAGSYCPASSCDRVDTLLLHWNGAAWSKVASPDSGSPDNSLTGVNARSADDAWAVGNRCIDTSTVCRTLILRWNGSAWTRVKSPDPGPQWNVLAGVTAISPDDAWAVGDYCSTVTPCHQRILMLHWNGTDWSQVRIPIGIGTNALNGVDATAPDDAWAVGGPVVLHWNGKAWSKS